MLELFYWPTPNGHKITLFLEEAKLPYRITPINIGKGEQFEPDFLAISPNNRMPALIDHQPAGGGAPISVFESGAILLYLAERFKQFIPQHDRGRYDCLQWLFWQMGGLGPMLGQNHHFSVYAPEQIPYAIDRYVRETSRLYGVLNKQLKNRRYILGDQYSIADMACYPWIVPWKRQQMQLSDFPDLHRWFEDIRARPATQKAYAIAEQAQYERPAQMTEDVKKILFGQSANTVK